jgi:hypothetical protein
MASRYFGKLKVSFDKVSVFWSFGVSFSAHKMVILNFGPWALTFWYRG